MELQRHPGTPARGITGVEVTYERAKGRLRLRYRVMGEVAALAIADGDAVRSDGLWRHTCFEAFVAEDGPDYREYNFAPSGAWAAYAFDGYRAGMHDADAEPKIAWDGGALAVELAVDLPDEWRVNLTAVIETSDGTKSYWALAHPDGPPDFHDPACFVLTLPAGG